jgi:cytochrome c553
LINTQGSGFFKITCDLIILKGGEHMMKKMFILSMLVVTVLFLMSGVALAGGWTKVVYSDTTTTHDPDGTRAADTTLGLWNPDTATGTVGSAEAADGRDNPHGGFSSATNRCRVCHAVHGAGEKSWRLLASGEVYGESEGTTDFQESLKNYGINRATECNYCHGNDGVTVLRPYRLKSWDVKGEHTLQSGTVKIPDSGDDQFTSGFSCGNCHSVHGANTLEYADAGGQYDAGDWGLKILKKEPNTAEIRTNDTTGMASSDYTVDAVRSNFCAHCHDRNPNWNASDPVDPDDRRANAQSHVQGPAADGLLEVYGTADTTVAAFAENDTYNNDEADGVTLGTDAQEGCRSCHRASELGNSADIGQGDADGDEGTDMLTADSAFPHQSTGTKFLFDDYTEGDQNGQTDAQEDNMDPDRVSEQMDQLCAGCHTNKGTFSASDKGVGESF